MQTTPTFGLILIPMLLGMLLSGCVAPQDLTACDTGDAPYLITRESRGGFLPWPGGVFVTTVDHDGTVTVLTGLWHEGERGAILDRTEYGIQGLTDTEIEDLAKAFDAWHADARDGPYELHVDQGWRAQLSDADRDDLCAAVLDHGYEISGHGDDPGCMDADTRYIKVSTAQGENEASAYCRGASDDFLALEEAIQDARKASWEVAYDQAWPYDHEV